MLAVGALAVVPWLAGPLPRVSLWRLGHPGCAGDAGDDGGQGTCWAGCPVAQHSSAGHAAPCCSLRELGSGSKRVPDLVPDLHRRKQHAVVPSQAAQRCHRAPGLSCSCLGETLWQESSRRPYGRAAAARPPLRLLRARLQAELTATEGPVSLHAGACCVTRGRAC